MTPHAVPLPLNRARWTPAPPWRSSLASLGLSLGLLSGLSATAATIAAEVGEALGAGLLRVGVSQASFGTANRNDATAALKVWAASVIKEHNLDLAARVEVFDEVDVLLEKLRAGEIDAASMVPTEFIRLPTKPDAIFVPTRGESYTERFVLVARRASDAKEVAHLAKRRLVVQSGQRTSLAQPWLETVLTENSLTNLSRFFGATASVDSPSKAILQVVFEQADACLVTQGAFLLALELNPNLERELVEIAKSPPLITGMFFFRPGVQTRVRKDFEDAILQLHSTPAGKQVLTVFQGSRMVKEPLSALESTYELLRRYDELQAGKAPKPVVSR